MRHTDEDFERLSWHDCHIWGLELRVGDADEGDWTSDLVLRIDFIVEWMCGTAGGCQFRVAPAELVFHDVTDPVVSIRWCEDGAGIAMHLLSIGGIAREDRTAPGGHPVYRWSIELNWPAGGEIAFGARGFTQTLLAEPILTERQHLTRAERRDLLGR